MQNPDILVPEQDPTGPVEIDPQLLKLISGGDGDDPGDTTPGGGTQTPKGTW